MSDQQKWDWNCIDVEMEKQYKAHGDTYQFLWVRELCRAICDDLTTERDALAAELAAVREELVSTGRLANNALDAMGEHNEHLILELARAWEKLATLRAEVERLRAELAAAQDTQQECNNDELAQHWPSLPELDGVDLFSDYPVSGGSQDED